MMLPAGDGISTPSSSVNIFSLNNQLFHHPGEGRGSGGKADPTERCTSLPTSPTWAPAFAGVLESGGATR
jgi:hypothetical protein